MSCDRNLEVKERLYEQYLEEGHSEQAAAELAKKAFEEMD